MYSRPGPNSNLDWLYEIRNGRAFALGTTTGAVAAELGHIQLLNPVGSTITVEVYLVLGQPTTLATVQVSQYDTGLTTLIGGGVNLKSGGAAGQATIRRQTNPAALGTLLHRGNAAANLPSQLGPYWMGTLTAGKGLVVINTNANEGEAAQFYWVEH